MNRVMRLASLAMLVAVAGLAADVRVASGAAPTPSFATPVGASRGGLPINVIVGAFGGPGTKLIATADLQGSRLRILDGTLAETLSVTGPANPVDMAAGDFDDDGYTDLAFVVAGQVQVWINAGTTTAPVFPGVTHTLVGGTGEGFSRIAVGDMNDGDPATSGVDHFDDLVAIGTYDDGFSIVPKAFVMLAAKNGTAFDGFQAPAAFICNQANGACAIGDVNDDAKADVVACDELGRQVVVMHGDGLGALNLDFGGTPQSFGTTHHLNSIAIGDVTGDGKADVVTGGYEAFMSGGELSVHVLRWTGSTLESASGFQVGTQAFDAPIDSALGIADVNGDGALDVAISNPTDVTNGVVSVLLFTGHPAGVNPFFLSKDAQYEFPTADAPWQLAAGDVTGDGKIDLVTANKNNDSVNVLRNTVGGGGGGGPALPAATDLYFTAPKVGKKYLGGGRWRFVCKQPADAGLTVKMQSTTNLGDDASWEDLPGGGAMTGSPSGDWILITYSIPSGKRYFRTVSSQAGHTDGVNSEATGPAAYLGPLTVLPAGAVVLSLDMTTFTANHLAAGKTAREDRILYRLQYKNVGTSTATNVKVSGVIPKNTLFVAADTGGKRKGSKVTWTIPSLAPGASGEFGFTVAVGPGVTFNEFVKSVGNSITAAKAGTDTIDSESLEVVNPLTVNISQTGSSATPGGLITYKLRCTNGQVYELPGATVTNPVPRDCTFVSANILDSNGDPVGLVPVYNRTTRLVTWNLGTLAAGESKDVRLVVRVQLDRESAGILYNESYVLSGTSPAGIAIKSRNDTAGFETPLSGTPGPGRPILRLEHFASAEGYRDTEAYGRVTTVLPGGRVRYTSLFQNAGDSDAEFVVLHGFVPQGTYLIADTMKLGLTHIDLPTGRDARFNFPGDNTFTVDIGTVGSGQFATVSYECSVYASPAPEAIHLGGAISSMGSTLTTDSLTTVVRATPEVVRTQIVKPVTFRIDTTSETILPSGDVRPGERVAYFITATNNGGVNAQLCKLTAELPKGLVFDGALLLDASGGPRVPSSGESIDSPDLGKAGTVTFNLATIPPGETRRVELDAKVPGRDSKGRLPAGLKPGDTIFELEPTMAFSYSRGPGAAATSLLKGTEGDKESNPLIDALAPKLMISKSYPPSAIKGKTMQFTLAAANVGTAPATGVKVAMQVPFETTLVPGGVTGGGVEKGGVVTWTIGTLAGGEHRILTMTVQVASDFHACAVTDNSCYVSATNAQSKKPGPSATQVRSEFVLFSWAESVGCLFTAQGAGLGGAQGEFAQANQNSLYTSVGGADIIILSNRTWMIPIGGDNIVAAGGGNLISLKNVAGFGTLTGAGVLQNGLGIVAAGGGNIVAAGGGNLVQRVGGVTQLIGLDGASLGPIRATGLVAVGKSAIVAAGGGNISAVGGASLIGLDGASLRSVDASRIVAAGGGNIVAAGGGNIVAGGGGN
ncbi:MAG: DUF11 domain-containing protein [Planctomycetes bacterium]|nr:DUF11 domain-containing protein [Planctomycetota bacterium]